MDSYSEICKEILKDSGPLLGSELKQVLVTKINVSETNARQIIYRLKNNKMILSTEPVKFQANQVLYFLSGQNIKYKLKEVMPDHAKTIDRLYHALVENDGFLHWTEFLKISAGVVDSEKLQNIKHKTADHIFRDMRKLDIVKEIKSYNYEKFVVANKEWVPQVNASELKMEKRIKDIEFSREFTGNLLEWVEKMNIVGWNSSHLIESEEGNLNGYYWDAYGFSYLWGLYNTKAKSESVFLPAEDKDGSLVVIESILYRNMNLYDVFGFISRVSVMYGRIKAKNNFRIIPICFAQSFDKEALSLLRKRGVIVITVSEVFGTHIAEALNKIRNIDPREIDAEALAEILALSDSSGHDGKFGSLKGHVFNFLVSSIFTSQGYDVMIGKKYNYNGMRCECDIVISVDDEYYIVCEAKGYNKGTYIELGTDDKQPDTVKKFVERTCNIVEKETGKKVLPIFITSADFTEEAINYLNEKKSTKKISNLLGNRNFPREIYANREMLIEFFGNKEKYTEHKKILKEFFDKHEKLE